MSTYTDHTPRHAHVGDTAALFADWHDRLHDTVGDAHPSAAFTDGVAAALAWVVGDADPPTRPMVCKPCQGRGGFPDVGDTPERECDACDGTGVDVEATP